MDRFIFVPLSMLLLSLGVHCTPPTIRQTQNGPVEGIEQMSSLGQKYYAFRGIPFAEAPITGRDKYTDEQVDRRFKAPEALKRQWVNALKVHDFGKKCKQPSTDEFPIDLSTTSEDCLFLNIFVPAGGAKQKTVMVWIHGGGFAFGDATDEIYGPDFLLSQDNIVVTIQYRLSMFGFLNLDYGEFTGNMGLKDQQLAMKWIYENIENFSGKKDEILLFGESAGGASVHFHMVNQESRKYFKRAFADSSSVFDAYAMRSRNHVQQVQECSKIHEMDKLIEYLKKESGDELVNCYPFAFSSDLDPVWVPTIEKPNTKGAFLTKSPEEIYESNEAPIMDSMFSFMAQEALPLFGRLFETPKPLLDENIMETTVRLPFDGFTKEAHPNEFKRAAEKLRQAYFTDTTSIAAIKRQNVALYSEMHFNYGILKATILQSKANKKAKNTFLFRFNVTTDFNMMTALFRIKFDEAVHGDDLAYLFHCHAFDQAKVYDKHLKLKDMSYEKIMQYVKIITNFARTGDPSIEGDTPFRSCQSSGEVFCQEISNEPNTRMTTNIMDQLHYDVWHDIEKIYKSLKDVSHEPKKSKEEL